MKLTSFIGPINQRFLTSMSIAFRTPEIIIKICEDMTACIFLWNCHYFPSDFSERYWAQNVKDQMIVLHEQTSKQTNTKPSHGLQTMMYLILYFLRGVMLKTRSLHPAHDNCQNPPAFALESVLPGCLVTLTVATLFVFLSYHQVLWLELPKLLFLLPHGPFLLQRC